MQTNPIEFKKNRVLFLAGGASASALAFASPMQAQSTATAIDPSSVNTQLTSVQTGITGVGGTLLAMGMGILLFIIGKKIIKRVTGS